MNYDEHTMYCDGCAVALEDGRSGFCDGCLAAQDEAVPTQPDQPRRGYIHTNAAWYADAVLAPDHPGEVLFGLYHTDGSTDGEMGMEWSMPRDRYVPALHVYDDAWGVLFGFADVLEALAEVANQHIGPVQFCAVLDRLGFADLTERERPTGR